MRAHKGADGSTSNIRPSGGDLVPGRSTLTSAIQRRGNDGDAGGDDHASQVAGLLPAAGGSGAALPDPVRGKMEDAFDFSFARVRIHEGESAAAMGAVAYTSGTDLHFAPGQYDPASSSGQELIGHELAHVVQQSEGRVTTTTQFKGVDGNDDAGLEAEADAWGAAAARGESVGRRGGGSGDRGVARDEAAVQRRVVQRTAITTNGGVFDNGPMYTAISGTGAVGERVGANIMLDFDANELVEAPANSIGLVQTVKGVTDRVPSTTTLNPTRDQGNTAVSTNADDTGLVNGNGFAVDIPVHQSGRTDANHNPIYGTGFSRPDASTNLQQSNPAAAATGTTAAVPERGTPSLGRSQRGSHVRNPDGTFQPVVNAQLEDGPGRVLGVAGQSFEMSFEVTALVTDGPMVNTYLGSVEWGWQSDAAGQVTLKPFVPLASGAPTQTFMQAAQTWNDATFHTTDAAATAVPTIDIPLTSLPSGVQAAVSLATPDLLARITAVRAEIAGLAGGTVDRTNKDFELRALDTELRKRKILVDLDCLRISDTGGAARPAEDEVWLAIEGPNMATTLTSTRTFSAGASHAYTFPITDFLPLDGPVTIRIMEHDRPGRVGRAHDDAVAELTWSPPFPPITHTEAGTGEYRVRVRFDR